MQSNRSSLPLLIALGLAAYLLVGRGDWSPLPRPEPPAGPDLVDAFSTNDDRAAARTHAHLFATICDSLADYLEYDGTRPQPLLKTGVQIDEFRRAIRQTRTKGWSFLVQYPRLEAPLEAHFTAAVGTSGGPVTPEQRAKWVTALRQVAACAEYAAGG
jgi:hypothetical protein